MADGSHTSYIPAVDEHCHSVNGALQESRHIFIETGLHVPGKGSTRIVEIGFGIGLDALLALKDVELFQVYHTDYRTVGLYPLPLDTIYTLNCGELIWLGKGELFLALYEAEWDIPVPISERSTLHKIEGNSNARELPDDIDLIYFDALVSEKQSEMWNQEIYNRLYVHTAPGGVIVAYCAKGEVYRGMQAAGSEMSRLSGPPGRRHILRGAKN